MLESTKVNLSKEMCNFYLDEVIVRKSVIDDLRKKKKINIQRLKDGLVEYNDENGTNYKIIENLEQGSVAMSTLIQSEDSDYDIDIAIIFDKEDFNIGCIESKNILVNALKRKTTKFNKEPELKTNCIRVYYESNYHIDFAMFRHCNDIYEHCGSQWRERNPRDINSWFKDRNNIYNNRLRIFARLLKTFCKSNADWVMPGGLMNTILVEEALNGLNITENFEEDFVNILKKIKNRLQFNKSINNPVNNQSLMLVDNDYTKTNNLYTRLQKKLEKYDELESSNTSKNDYINFWKEFFNNDYWSSDNENLASLQNRNFEYDELFIENFYKNANKINTVDIKCYKINNSFANDTLRKNAASYFKKISVRKEETFVFYVNDRVYCTNENYFIWKIKNYGIEAEMHNCIRGDFYFGNHQENMNNGQENINCKERLEKSSYSGTHTVECYIFEKISNNIIAKGEYVVEIV